jgi:hypothetical protein
MTIRYHFLRSFTALRALTAAGLCCVVLAAGTLLAAGREKPWTERHAAHLLRRAGFGGTPEQVEYLVRLGRDGAVDYLLHFEGAPPLGGEPAFEPEDRLTPQERRELNEEERERLRILRNRRDHVRIHELRKWWISQMVASPRPLEEKIVLFWHGHFTSGHREVKSAYLMWRQQKSFREHAVGNYRALLLAVATDPAMTLYLNNAQNVKGHPNENFARELMELFTLGVGHYTERDVVEAARAFTGWGIDRQSGEFLFRRGQHDDGVKTVLGVTGRLNGGDVIDIILKRPQAAEYLVRRLWRFFAGETPPPPVVRQLAATFRHNKYEIKPLLRALFLHDAFYADDVMASRVKSPVELLVGLMRELEIPAEDLDAMVYGLRLMGQDLFQPPNVKGWDGGAAWINTATMYHRYNVAGRLISGTGDGRTGRGGWGQRRRAADDDDEMMMLAEALVPTGPQSTFDPAPILRRHDLQTAEAVLDHFLERMLPRPMSAPRRAVLLETLGQLLSDPANVQSRRSAEAIRELLMLIVATPEYQLS